MPFPSRSRRSTFLVRTIAAAAMFLTMGCGVSGRPGIRVAVLALWDADEHRLIERLSSPESAQRSSVVSLDGACNETLSFWLAVTPGDQPVANPDFIVHPLHGVGGVVAPGNVTLYRAHPVDVASWPGWHIRSIPPKERDAAPLDVLVPIGAPRGGLPSLLRSAETYAFLVDVAVPKGTLDGVYNGRIELTSGGKPVAEVAVQLTVWPFVLPDESDFVVLAELDHRTLLRHHLHRGGRPFYPTSDNWTEDEQVGRIDALLQDSLRWLRRFRLTPVLSRLAPAVQPVDGLGDISVDWSAYDRIVAPLMDGTAMGDRRPLNHWPLPIGSVFTAARPGPRNRKTSLSRWQRGLVHACVDHFENRGWLSRAYFLPDAEDAFDCEAFAVSNDLLCALANVDPRLPLASPYFPHDPRPFGWPAYAPNLLCDHVAIWAPQAQYFDPPAMAEQRKRGRRTWMRVDRPPYSGSVAIQASGSARSALGWQAYAHDIEALALGCINEWPLAETNPTPEDCLYKDSSALIFPGGPFGLNHPVASLRLIQLRRALAVGAWRRLLKEHGLGHIPKTLAKALGGSIGTETYATHFADGRAADWPSDDRVFGRGRRLMLDALLAHEHHPWFAGAAAEARRALRWRRFMDEFRTIGMKAVGAKVRIHTHAAGSDVRFVVSVVLENRSRGTISGHLEFTQLPNDWAAPPPYAVEALAPGESRRMVLTIDADRIAPSGDGLFFAELTLRTATGVAHHCPVRVATMVAPWTERAPRLDGDLSDWPVSVGNAAAGFALISGPSGCGHDRNACAPLAKTQVFARVDKDHLYVAFRCQTAPGAAEGGNAVDHDDMIPTGGDLIEVLLDPLNSTTRTPSDLYHIAIKPSGTILTEKGIRLEPPCGRSEAWPARIRYGVQRWRGGWSVEMAIPIASMGKPDSGVATWGVNFCRYDATNQEYATWSGAVGNSYDPLSMGALIWMRPGTGEP